MLNLSLLSSYKQMFRVKLSVSFSHFAWEVVDFSLHRPPAWTMLNEILSLVVRQAVFLTLLFPVGMLA